MKASCGDDCISAPTSGQLHGGLKIVALLYFSQNLSPSGGQEEI